MQRMLHPGLASASADFGADAVVHTDRDHRPAVVFPCANDVDLVAALRSVLVRPQLARLGMRGGTLYVAVAVGELLGLRVLAVSEWIVFRHAAVFIESDHRTG